MKAAIAGSYGVHNRMFVSVPGPSWPNHNFAQSATSCGISGNVMYNRCGGEYPQCLLREIYMSSKYLQLTTDSGSMCEMFIPRCRFPQMTIYDSLALADVPFGLYVNMTCGPNDPKNSTAESCSKVHPGWGAFNGNNSNGLDPDVLLTLFSPFLGSLFLCLFGGK